MKKYMWGSEGRKNNQDEQDATFARAANPEAVKPEISEHENRLLKRAENTKQVSANKARHKKRRGFYEKDFDELFGEMTLDPNRSPEEQVYLKELHEVLKNAWDDHKTVQPHLKEVLYQYFFKGKSVQQIAKRCKLKNSEVAYYLDDAIGQLRHSKHFEEIYFKNKQTRGNFEIN